MFATRYFAAPMFAPRYFPKIGQDPVMGSAGGSLHLMGVS